MKGISEGVITGEKHDGVLQEEGTILRQEAWHTQES